MQYIQHAKIKLFELLAKVFGKVDTYYGEDVRWSSVIQQDSEQYIVKRMVSEKAIRYMKWFKQTTVVSYRVVNWTINRQQHLFARDVPVDNPAPCEVVITCLNLQSSY